MPYYFTNIYLISDNQRDANSAGHFYTKITKLSNLKSKNTLFRQIDLVTNPIHCLLDGTIWNNVCLLLLQYALCCTRFDQN